MTDSIFSGVGILFPRCRHNVVDVSLLRFRNRTRDGRRRKSASLLELGETTRTSITVAPIGTTRLYEGTQLSEAITAHINSDYWLIAFWEKLTENAKYSALSREMVRAFILNCGAVIVEDLYDQKRDLDHIYIRKQGLMPMVTFYERAFVWTQIFRCMRRKYRDEFRNRIYANHESKKWHTVTDSDVIANLDAINQVLADAGLPELLRSSTAQMHNVRSLVVTLAMTVSGWRNESRLRKGLLRAIVGSKILKV
ncbi:MAG: hypothetical protein ACYC7A_11465 [Thermoanaerobaculia bacterium]